MFTVAHPQKTKPTSLHSNRGYIAIALITAMMLIPVLVLLSTKLYSSQEKTTQKQSALEMGQQFLVDQRYMIASAADPDGDGYQEFLKEGINNAFPVGAPHQNDPFGVAYRYCTWDLGTANVNSIYSQNNTPHATIPDLVARIISAGPDKTFQTTCSDATAKGDDTVFDVRDSDVKTGKVGTASGWAQDGANINQRATTAILNNAQILMDPSSGDDIVKKSWFDNFLSTFTPSASTSEPLYVDDVFSTYLYTGNGSTQTINNGINLAGEGGLVWFKVRSDTMTHVLFDTVREASKALVTAGTEPETVGAGTIAFNVNGFTTPSAETSSNGSGKNYTS